MAVPAAPAPAWAPPAGAKAKFVYRYYPATDVYYREKDKVWLVAGVEGIKAGDELTYDYGSDYYPRKGKRAE